MSERAKDRHQRLMAVRQHFNAGMNEPYSRHPATGTAVDYLFYELDLLIAEVEELKAPMRQKNSTNPGSGVD